MKRAPVLRSPWRLLVAMVVGCVATQALSSPALAQSPTHDTQAGVEKPASSAPVEPAPAAPATPPPSTAVKPWFPAADRDRVGRVISRLEQEKTAIMARAYRIAKRKDALPLRGYAGERYSTVDLGSERWEFVWNAEGKPTRAWRNIDRSGEHGYVTERIGYCRDSADVCARWFEQARDRAQPPRFPYGHVAKTEWTNRILIEACEPGPDDRPLYLAMDRAFQKSGAQRLNARILVYINPCGEVRHAEVRESSGYPPFDLAARDWALRARLTREVAKSPNGEGAVGTMPIQASL